MSILITGGTGFIGAEVARQLLTVGDDAIFILQRSQNFQRMVIDLPNRDWNET